MTSILELEEAQGMTAEMIRGQMKALGHPLRACQNYPVCPSLGSHTHHGKGGSDFIVPDTWNDSDNQWPTHNLRASLQLAATMAGLSIQELLRRINPRMRSGRPSIAALQAVEYWLVRDVETGEVELHNSTCFSKYLRSVLGSADFPQWEYWPCDARGNKVPWPTDEHGTML